MAIRRNRLMLAWLVALAGGLFGMGLWLLLVNPGNVARWVYGLSAVVFSGFGIFIGALFTRRFLSAEEQQHFFRAPPDDA